MYMKLLQSENSSVTTVKSDDRHQRKMKTQSFAIVLVKAYLILELHLVNGRDVYISEKECILEFVSLNRLSAFFISTKRDINLFEIFKGNIVISKYQAFYVMRQSRNFCP